MIATDARHAVNPRRQATRPPLPLAAEKTQNREPRSRNPSDATDGAKSPAVRAFRGPPSRARTHAPDRMPPGCPLMTTELATERAELIAQNRRSRNRSAEAAARRAELYRTRRAGRLGLPIEAAPTTTAALGAGVRGSGEPAPSRSRARIVWLTTPVALHAGLDDAALAQLVRRDRPTTPASVVGYDASTTPLE